MPTFGKLRGKLLAAVLLLVPAAYAFADTLIMDNGDHLTGTSKHVEKGKLTFTTTYAGDLTIDVAHIKSLESDQLMTLDLDKTQHIYGTLTAHDGKVLIRPEDGSAPLDASVKDFGVVLTGRVTGREWKQSGHVNVGGSDTNGNTVTSRGHIDAEIVQEREKFRVIGDIAANYASDHGAESESNALASIKYDRFITQKQYGYGNLTLEHDKFKDIKLRDTIGAGRGYDAVATPRTNLSIEGGLSYVYTDFYSAPDDRYPAARVAVRFDYFVIPARFQIFHQSEVFVGLDGISKSFAHSKTGLRLPLRGNFVAGLEYDVDWDGNPAPGSQTTDRSVILTLGYHW